MTVPAVQTEGATAAVWARAHLRDLEDRYVTAGATYGSPHDDLQTLERQIVAVSLRHQVLCRFTALVAVDSRVVAEGGPKHRVAQPAEFPAGWDPRGLAMPSAPARGFAAAGGYAAAAFAPVPLSASGNPAAARSRRGQSTFSRGLQRGARLFQEQQQPADHDPLADARAQAAAEAHLLRTAGTTTSAQRRIILSDLASRLDALTRNLGPELDSLRQLVSALKVLESSPAVPDDQLDNLWEQALNALDTFAGNAKPPASPTGPKREFWKRL